MAAPTKSRQIDYLNLAKLRLYDAKERLGDVKNNIIVAYTDKLHAQVGSYQRLIKVGKSLYERGVPMSAEQHLPEDFKVVDGVNRKNAAQFIKFAAKLEVAIELLNNIIADLDRLHVRAAVILMGRLSAQVSSLVGESNMDYLSLFLSGRSLSRVRDGLGRVHNFVVQSSKMLIAAGAQSEAA